ncbi:MAG: hypothetical protein ABIH34_07670 [Nanoarchaeota archaeon]
MGNNTLEGPALPDLPEIPQPPKRSFLGLFKKSQQPSIPEPPGIEPNAFDEISEKIEQVKIDFDKEAVPRKTQEEIKKAHDHIKQKQKEFEDTKRVHREKEMALSKKECILAKKDEELASKEKKLDELKKELNRQEDALKAEEATLKRSSEEHIKRVDKAKRDISSRDKAVMTKEIQGGKTVVDPEVKAVLKMLDKLLEKLPDDVIKTFSQSKDFTLYSNVMKRQGLP